MGYPLSRPRMGYLPPVQTWNGVLRHPDMRWGTPPPLPVEVWTDTQSENITLPHPSDAGGIYTYRSLAWEAHYFVTTLYWAPDIQPQCTWDIWRKSYFPSDRLNPVSWAQLQNNTFPVRYTSVQFIQDVHYLCVWGNYEGEYKTLVWNPQCLSQKPSLLRITLLLW